MTTLQDEVSFINGLNPDNTVAATSFWTWQGNNPATYTYSTTGGPGKWGPDSTPGTTGGTVLYYFDPAAHWNSTEKKVFIAAMTLWSDEANIKFALAPDASQAQLTFKRGADGSAYEKTTATTTDGHHLSSYTSAYISIDTTVAGFGPLDGGIGAYGGYVWETAIHELGHALGLGHGGPYNGAVNEAVQQYSAYDSRLWSVMSYIDMSYDHDAKYYADYPVYANWTTPADYYYHDPNTPMALDILAVQQLYGAPVTTALSGGQVFGFGCNIKDAAKPFFDFTVNTLPVVTLWDAGTGNTLNLSGFTYNSIVDLNPGSFSSCAGMTNNLCIAFNTHIDTAIGGTGNDTLKANDDGDLLKGGEGGDTLIGGAGVDRLYGGAGDDTYVVAAGDRIYEYTHDASVDDGGTDTVMVSVNWTLGHYLENLTLTGSSALNGTGNELNNVITGNDAANTLKGLDGNDRLDGGLGNDKMYGGAGDDTYVVDSTSDGVYEYVYSGTTKVDTGGVDTVETSISLTLGLFVENLTLTGSAAINGTGNDLANVITGNSGDNTLNGAGGDDNLYGGGAGHDFLDGGAGKDILVGGGSGVTAASYASATAAVTVSLALQNNWQDTGSAGSDFLTQINNLTGSKYNDILTGDGNANVLDGGLGNDTLYGGGGNDTYVIDNSFDIVSEQIVFGSDDGGTDTVMSPIDYTLGAFIENLTLTGINNRNGTGNELANILTGNDGHNTLRGLGGADYLDGGASSDTMYGGAGDDTYVVDVGTDTVREDTFSGFDDGGHDKVISSISYTLGNFVEDLDLAGIAVNGSGNSLDNHITGNSGDNSLLGYGGNDVLDGGAGADRMYGGSGDDTYYVDNAGDKAIEDRTTGVDDGGVDLVISSVSFILGNFVENLTLTGSTNAGGAGNALNNIIIGNSGGNILTGNGGNDTLTGGLGHDSFAFSTAASNGLDHLTDFLSGTDHLRFKGSDYGFAAGHVLTAGELSLTGSAVSATAQFVYDPATHTLYWDSDGTGATAAIALAIFDNAATPATGDFTFT